MRIASVAAGYHADLDALQRVAKASCELTHAHPLGVVGAQLQARAIVEAIRADPGSVDPVAMLDRVRSGCDPDLDDGTYERAMNTVETLLEAGKPAESADAANRLGNDSRAFASVPTAIYAALAHPDDFEEAVGYAVAISGDADTIGAMAGAISGGLHDVSAVPEDWFDALENGPRGRDHVVELGRELADLATQ
jgi:poly(ADP-ribose) glycohydrolase ARH3